MELKKAEDEKKRIAALKKEQAAREGVKPLSCNQFCLQSTLLYFYFS